MMATRMIQIQRSVKTDVQGAYVKRIPFYCTTPYKIKGTGMKINASE
jgi:hypothetical protein